MFCEVVHFHLVRSERRLRAAKTPTDVLHRVVIPATSSIAVNVKLAPRATAFRTVVNHVAVGLRHTQVKVVAVVPDQGSADGDLLVPPTIALNTLFERIGMHTYSAATQQVNGRRRLLKAGKKSSQHVFALGQSLPLHRVAVVQENNDHLLATIPGVRPWLPHIGADLPAGHPTQCLRIDVCHFLFVASAPRFRCVSGARPAEGPQCNLISASLRFDSLTW
mmetsp:Transcript_53356/g.120301  ORF Transcript_53356/g.120301 Transcript_53356/m.120301 type:complete len:221 (-) Transcript_53356:555-1217(-)